MGLLGWLLGRCPHCGSRKRETHGLYDRCVPCNRRDSNRVLREHVDKLQVQDALDVVRIAEMQERVDALEARMRIMPGVVPVDPAAEEARRAFGDALRKGGYR